MRSELKPTGPFRAYMDGVLVRLKAERAERRTRDGWAKLYGCRVSSDHGKVWRLFALCHSCMRSAEPPLRVKSEGQAGAMSCDWCGAYNEVFKEEYE